MGLGTLKLYRLQKTSLLIDEIFSCVKIFDAIPLNKKINTDNEIDKCADNFNSLKILNSIIKNKDKDKNSIIIKVKSLKKI